MFLKYKKNIYTHRQFKHITKCMQIVRLTHKHTHHSLAIHSHKSFTIITILSDAIQSITMTSMSIAIIQLFIKFQSTTSIFMSFPHLFFLPIIKEYN